MRIFYSLTFFMLLFGATFTGVQAQIPSDTASLPYSVVEMVNEIQVAIETPSQTNEYAHFVLQESNFPSGIVVGTPLTVTQKQNLVSWVKSNPKAIETLLIERKKNYDKYFNPATQ